MVVPKSACYVRPIEVLQTLTALCTGGPQAKVQSILRLMKLGNNSLEKQWADLTKLVSPLFSLKMLGALRDNGSKWQWVAIVSPRIYLPC